MKKEIEFCDNCSEISKFKIIKGKQKGIVLCEDCFTDWADETIDNMEGKYYVNIQHR